MDIELDKSDPLIPPFTQYICLAFFYWSYSIVYKVFWRENSKLFSAL